MVSLLALYHCGDGATLSRTVVALRTLARMDNDTFRGSRFGRCPVPEMWMANIRLLVAVLWRTCFQISLPSGPRIHWSANFLALLDDF